MKKRILSIFLAALMVVSLLPVTASAAETLTGFAGGNGTSGNPYQISNLTQLENLADIVNGGKSCADTYFKLTADINGFTKMIGFDEMGTTSDRPFSGYFDGDFHTVTLNITGGIMDSWFCPYAAMFGYVDGGEIKNVITAGTVTVQNHYTANYSCVCVGGVCASIGNGSIINCGNRANISVTNADFHGATSHIGGVCAKAGGSIYNLTTALYETRTPNITNCYNTGDINVTYKNTMTETYTLLVGGVCSENYGQIKNCYNAGEVKTTKGSDSSTVSSRVASGGVCGDNYGTITKCYNNNSYSPAVAYTSSIAGVSTDATDMISSSMQDSTFVATLNGNMGSGSKVMWTRDSATNKGYPYLICGFKITYEENGGTPAQTDLLGQLKIPDTLPTIKRAGYEFGGWYTDSGYTKLAVAGAAISQDTMLYAKWTQHNFTYTAEGNVITATCDNEGCDLQDKKVALTLTADGKIYDGTAYTAATDDATVKFAETTCASVGDIQYYAKDGEGWSEAPLGAAPKDVGTYKATVTVTYGESQTVTAEKEFTISRANLTATDFSCTPASPLTYDGTEKAATVEFVPGTNGRTGCGEITVKYAKQTGTDTWDTATATAPKDAGTYKVSISVTGSTNFVDVDDLSAAGWTFTIAQREVTLTWQPASGDGAIDLVYSGTAKVPTVTAGNLVDGEKVKVAASVTPTKDNVNVGIFTFTATGFENEEEDTTKLDNYKLPDFPVSCSYTITKYNTTLTNVSTKLDYRNGEKQTITFTPTSPEGAADALKQENFDVKYYKVDEDYGTVINATPLLQISSIGRYIYVVTLKSGHDNYQFDPSATFTGTVTTSTTETAVAGKVNAGIVAIGVDIPAMQKPISFASGLVNKLVTDTTVTNALSNDNAGATVTYTSSNTDVATVATDGTVTIKGAGSTTITAQSHVDGMTDVYAAYTLNVSKKEITVTVKDQTVKYGKDSPYTTDATLSDVLSFSETIDTTGITPTFSTSYVVGKSVKEYAVRVTLPESTKYSYVYVPGTLTVEPKELTVADFDVTAANKTYDGNVTATVTATVKNDSLVSTDALTVTAVGSFDSVAVGTGKTVTYTITGISGAKAGNYVFGTAEQMKGTAKADITKMPITFSFGTSDFSYDGGKKTVAVSAVDKDNRVFTDYTVEYYSGQTKLENAPSDVGTYTVKAVYDTDKYELKNGTVSEKQLTIAAGNAVVWASAGTEHLFNDANKTITAKSVPALDLNVTYYAVDNDGTVGEAVEPPSALGKYLYVITLADNDANKNYTIGGALEGTPTGDAAGLAAANSNVGIMTVSEDVQPELHAEVLIEKTYGDGKFTPTVTGGADYATKSFAVVSGSEFIDVNEATGEITIVKPGTAVVKVTASKAGYTDATAQFAVRVEKKLIEISLDDEITYAGKTLIAPYTLSGVVDGGQSVTSDNIFFTYQSVTDENIHDFRNVDTYYVTAEIPAENAYYRSNGAASQNIAIIRASLTITADDKTVTYGDAAPTYTVSYTTTDHTRSETQLLGEDLGTYLEGTAAFTCTYAQFDDATTYEISVAGLTSPNYNITFEKGTLTVNPLPVNLSWSTDSFTYDGQEHSITATVANAVNGDTVNITAYADNAKTTAGNYTAEATALDDGNYTLTGGSPLTKSWSISKKPVTVKPANVSIYVNGTAELKLDVSALLSADREYTGTPTFTLTDKDSQSIELADAVKTAGTYTITWTNPDDVTFAADYSITKTTTATLTVSNYPTGGMGGGSTGDVTVPVSGDGDSIEVKVTISGGNATLKNVTSEELGKIGTGKEVTVDLTTLDESVTGIIIPKTTLENITASDADGLEVKFPDGTVVVFDKTTVAAISAQAQGKDIRLVVDRDSKAEQSMTAAQKETLKTLNNPVVLDAYFVSGGKRISDFKGGEAELTAVYPTEKPVRIWYVKDDGTKELVPGTFDGKAATFVVTHFSHYVIEELDIADYTVCPQDETCVYAKFTDADTKAWYHPGVHFCVENGYMVGVADTLFAPSGTLSRAMIVTMLWRMEGSPVVNYAMSFKDVKGGQWYTEAIRWAQSTGVVMGYDAEHFGPNDNVTREQLAAILMRYAAFKGINVSGRADLAKFTDADAISAWALENVKWANAVGIINGRTETTIVPTGNATRAEAACMVQRFCETVLDD